MHAFRLCARVRDRRQTLMLGARMAIANVLATSYCNLAAPLVCFDLLEHACWRSQGQGPDNIFCFESFGPARAEKSC